jgi:hypothetical protein
LLSATWGGDDRDWLILKNACWSRDIEGAGLLDVEIYNPTKPDAAGGDVEVHLEHGRDCDEHRGNMVEIPVTAVGPPLACAVAASKSGQCGPKIAAPDPGDTRPLIRPLKFVAACGGFSAIVDIGPTGRKRYQASIHLQAGQRAHKTAPRKGPSELLVWLRLPWKPSPQTSTAMSVWCRQ